MLTDPDDFRNQTRLTLSRPRKPVVNFGWIGATMAFGDCFIDPTGVQFLCVIPAALQAHSSNVP
jgi:hypothetical protein